ncbi:MAG: hypothetical protein V1850_00705, partial [Candidatus Bathyarchaeota archaeon]
MKWLIVVMILTVMIAGCTNNQTTHQTETITCNPNWVMVQSYAIIDTDTCKSQCYANDKVTSYKIEGGYCYCDINNCNPNTEQTLVDLITNTNFIGTIRAYGPGSISGSGDLTLTLESRWPNPITVKSITGHYPNNNTIVWDVVGTPGFMPMDKKLVNGVLAGGDWNAVGAVKGANYTVFISIIYT